MSKIEILFFGSIAAIVLLSWLNTAIRRQRYQRYMRYRYPLPLPAHSAPRREDRERLNLSAVLIMGLVLLATAIGLVKVKQSYVDKMYTIPNEQLSSGLTTYQVEDASPPGQAVPEAYSPLDAPRKRGAYKPKVLANTETADFQNLTIHSGYGIQIAALSNKLRAEQQLKQLKRLLPYNTVLLGSSPEGEENYFRILVGIYPDLETTKKHLTMIRRYHPGSFPVDLSKIKVL